MGIHLGRVGHIGIHVSDVDRSIDFYRRVLGLKLTGALGAAGHRASDLLHAHRRQAP
jgi:catechol 2,3-dioxygenase-like lactoylglutathione lyase family enzyme